MNNGIGKVQQGMALIRCRVQFMYSCSKKTLLLCADTNYSLLVQCTWLKSITSSQEVYIFLTFLPNWVTNLFKLQINSNNILALCRYTVSLHTYFVGFTQSHRLWWLHGGVNNDLRTAAVLTIPLFYQRVSYHCVKFSCGTSSQLVSMVPMYCVRIPFSDLIWQRDSLSHHQNLESICGLRRYTALTTLNGRAAALQSWRSFC